MTSGGFLSLYYTDCRPGQGLRGGAGFQFQSVSAGVGHDTMTLVQRSALYEAPVGWMREHRAVDSYPPSLTHVFDGRYVTARGVYLGAEANGVREGNQFTHAVTTSDPDAYGLIRPAQLWNAPWWSEQPAASTECDPVAAQPEQGPWGIDAIQEWVLGQPDAEDWLVAVGSAFDRVQEPNRRRVLFVGEDAATILGWIAAGTLLLPQPRALRLGFRVFATNPQYSQHDVLGLHPDWAGAFGSTGRDRDFVVFNLHSREHSVVEHTDSAAYWAPRFLRADPLDVVDAIELAHKFAWQRSQRASESPSAADARAGSDDRLASAVVVLGESVERERRSGALAGWLARQPLSGPEDIEEIVEPVARAVLATSADATALGELDRAVWQYDLRGELAGQVRGDLLAAEVGDVMSGQRAGADAEQLPELTPAQQSSGAEIVERAADQIPPDRMDLLLRTSKRFHIEPDAAKFRNAAHRFVTWWADHPTAGLDPAHWPPRCGAMLVDQLRNELAQRPDSAALREDVRRYWWRLLLPLADPGTSLGASVAAAAMEHGEPTIQRSVLRAALEFVQRSDRTDAGDLAWDALFRHVPPTKYQLRKLLDQVSSASESFASKALDALSQLCGAQVTEAELAALDRLATLGWEPTDSRLSDLWHQDQALRQWLASVPARTPHQAGDAAADLPTVPKTVFRARKSQVLSAMLDELPLAHVRSVLDRAIDHLQSVLLDELPGLWDDPSNDGRRGDRAVAVTVAVAFNASKSKTFAHRPVITFLTKFDTWNSSVDPQRLNRVTRLLESEDHELSQHYRDYRQQLDDVKARKKKASTGEAGPTDNTEQQAKRSRWSFPRLRREK